MKVDELQTFIENNLYADVPKETYNEIMGDAESMDLYSFNEKWGQYLNENSDGWTTMKKDFKSLPERLTNAFGTDDKKNPFNRSKNELDEIYKKDFSDDVSREQFDKALQQQSNYWEDFKKERERESGEIRRGQEVKNWSKQPGGWYRNLLASEYEKEKYIKEPEKALFGKEAPMLGEAPDARLGSVADLGVGAAAAVADVVPTPYMTQTWLGPALRGARDVAHYYGSDYKKDLGQIASDVGSDVMFNVGTDILPTALLRRGTKTVKNAKKAESVIKSQLNKASDYYDAKKALENIDTGVDVFGNNDWMTTYKIAKDPEKWMKEVEKLPDGPMKNELASLEEATLEKKMQALTNWQSIAGETNPNIYKVLPNDEKVLKPYFSKEFSKPQLGEMKKIRKGNLDNASRTTRALAGIGEGWKSYGESGVKLAKTGAGRSSKANYDLEKEKDWFKQNYTRDWLLGFKPYPKEQQTNSPKWQAYKEWYFEKYGEMPKEDF